MTVLYLTNNAGRASTTVATRGWIEHLMPRGLRPVVASPVGGEFQEWVERQGGSFYKTDLPFPDKTRPWAFARALWGLWRLVRRERVDIVHCNEQEIYPIAGWLAKTCRLPVVVSVHFTMERPFCEWMFGRIHTPDRILFISRGSLEACRPAVTGVIPEDRWRLLPNGLDLDAYRRDDERRARFRAAHRLADEIAIGVGCAIRPRKQLEHLFDVAARLRDLPLKVFVAGGPVPGDEAYSVALLAGARERLGDRFVFLGYLNELRDLYNGLDIFVNTSREEACSISVLESLACGCPVLGYASKSVDDQVLPSGGEMVPQDDVDALTAAVKRWTARPLELAERRAGARAQAERLFDIRALSDDLWREYQELTGSRPVS